MPAGRHRWRITATDSLVTGARRALVRRPRGPLVAPHVSPASSKCEEKVLSMVGGPHL